MFCNISTREIKRNISKENISTNDTPLQFSYLILYSYSEKTVSKWNDKQNLFFFINHFMNNFTNSVINGTHSE